MLARIIKGVCQLKKNYNFEYDCLSFRAISLYDTDNIVRWRSDEEIIKYYYNPIPITKESHIKWFNDIYLNTSSRYDFIVILDEMPIGFTSILNIDFNSKSAEISYTIGELAARGKGLGVKMLSAMVEFGFEEFSIKQFIAGIRKDNAASIKTAISAGFECTDYTDSEGKCFLNFIRRM